MATKELLFYLLSGDEDYVHMHAGVIHINPSAVPAGVIHINPSAVPAGVIHINPSAVPAGVIHINPSAVPAGVIHINPSAVPAGVIHINPSAVSACIGQLVHGLDELHGAAQLGELQPPIKNCIQPLVYTFSHWCHYIQEYVCEHACMAMQSLQLYLSCSRHACTIHIADGLFLIHAVYVYYIVIICN